MELELLAEQVFGCAVAVHSALGPGYVSSVYENALSLELERRYIPFERDAETPVIYRDVEVGRHRCQLLVDKQLVIELKAINQLEEIHYTQVRSYLKAFKLQHGMLINFDSMPLKVKRVIYDLETA
ncbi:GxxExxY protein [Coraliomargarita akajimensis]|uniref:GxxExxY protein n=1 Tax=Coraliomargarita akajimensis (strain DSM 45221 / IAM 15411 / JCM 23193 / KCTC 12865 / 04OKA010-24) TaxID=583355 RepID=D5ELK6_CORAD|nr:GxxExxY protein [Coraliomargarita akajimensis]ADE55142.1 conserved hypothetical protein [Coraliomargarita akajimensis DSM 45221]